MTILRTKSNGFRHQKNRAALLPHDNDETWNFESCNDDDQRNSYESHSSRTSEYELSEQSSDTGIESLSLKFHNTVINDETSYMTDGTKEKTHFDTVSTSSSLNSEEGYYSNHDISVATLIGESQADAKKLPVLAENIYLPPIAFQFPEMKNQQTSFKLLKMKEQSNQLAKVEIEIFSSTCSLIESNESPQMTVKYLSSVFDKSGKSLSKHLSSSTTLENIIHSDNEESTNDFIGDLKESATSRQRSFSAYQISTSNSIETKKNSNLRFNSIRRIGSNAFTVEKLSEVDNESDQFILRDAFGTRFLTEAENFFEPKFTRIRDLIMKFESKK